MVPLETCICGGRLVRAVGEETIRTVDGEELRFRRRSDYVVCPSCLRGYRVVRLRTEDDADTELSGAAVYFSDLYDDEGEYP